MNKKILIFIYLFSQYASAEYNILFFGNSFTKSRVINVSPGVTLFVPSLPSLVEEIAIAAGNTAPYTHDTSYGSATLSGHINNSSSAITQNIQSGQEWDYVVMQDQSKRPTSSLGNPVNHKISAYQLFNSVRNHSPNVIPVLFETWAREPGHSFYPNDFVNAEAMQLELREGYAGSAYYIDAIAFNSNPTTLTAPIGDAWELANWDDLFITDQVHMNARGRLLSALVMYSTLYLDDVYDLFLQGALNEILNQLLLDQSDGAFLAEKADLETGLYNPEAADVYISELLVDAANPHSAADANQEFFELRSVSDSLASLNGLTFIYIDGDGSNAGNIDIALNLGGLSTGPNGIFVWSDGNTLWNPPADPISTIQTGQFTNQDGNGNGNDMENGSATFAVVSGYHGTYNQDLDLDNDGQLDITPWASVISAVGWTENSNNTEIEYAQQMGGHSFSGNHLGQTPYAYSSNSDGNFAFGSYDYNIDGNANGLYIVGNNYGDSAIDSNNQIYNIDQLNPLFSLTPGNENNCITLDCANASFNIPISMASVLILYSSLIAIFYKSSILRETKA